MKKEINITIPDHFDEICQFMEISPIIFLERFVENILSTDDTEKPDNIELILAMRYFLTYSENRNKIYDFYTKVKSEFIFKSVNSIDGFLSDLSQYSDGERNRGLQEFLSDWRKKWFGIIKIMAEDDVLASNTESENKIRNWYKLPPFESICLDTFAHVVLRKGESEDITIDASRELSKFVEAKVEENRLWVSTTTNGFNTFPEATIYITYASLNGLVVHHSGNVSCEQSIDVPKLGLVQNGRGNIDLSIDVLSLDVTLNKTGNLTLRGSADSVRIQNHRSGNFNGIELETTSANVIIHGSGSVSIQVEDELFSMLHGSGDLLYKGMPRMKSSYINGTGRIKSV